MGFGISRQASLMAKKIKSIVKLQVQAGKATPAPPIGPSLAQHGINLGADTVNQHKTHTQGVEQGDVVDDAGYLLALDKAAIDQDNKGFFPMRMDIGRRKPERFNKLGIFYRVHVAA